MGEGIGREVKTNLVHSFTTWAEFGDQIDRLRSLAVSQAHLLLHRLQLFEGHKMAMTFEMPKETNLTP